MSMKHSVFSVSVLSLAVLVSGCEMLKMPEKMDETKDLIGQTTGEVSRTNLEVKKTNTQMGDMNDAVHKQTLLVALDDMYKDKNTEMLIPAPFGMFAGGKTFAEKATENELVDWFYVKYKEVLESTPVDSKRIAVPVLVPKFDENGNKVFEAQYSVESRGNHLYAVPQTDWVFPKEYIDSFNKNLDIALNSMEIVASFIPQTMIHEMVEKEIGRGDLREQTVYLILNLRDAFTRSTLLKLSLYEDKLKNLKQVEEAIRLVENLEYISALSCAKGASCADGISATIIKGYLNVSENYVYAQQVKASDLAGIQPIKLNAETSKGGDGAVNVSATYTPVQVAFDPTAPANNPNQTDYKIKDDGLAVEALDQSAVRAQLIAYDSKANPKDWKELQRHFTQDLSKDAQLAGQGPAVLARIKSHIH